MKSILVKLNFTSYTQALCVGAHVLNSWPWPCVTPGSTYQMPKPSPSSEGTVLPLDKIGKPPVQRYMGGGRGRGL